MSQDALIAWMERDKSGETQGKTSARRRCQSELRKALSLVSFVVKACRLQAPCVGSVKVEKGDVWIAPQLSKKAQMSEAEGAAASTKVELEPLDIDLLTTRYQDLVGLYDADSLRVAARRETIFEVLTGSHVLVSHKLRQLFDDPMHSNISMPYCVCPQPAKLSEMTYTGLQIITRSRDVGIPVDDITKTTGYSSGTMFYIVKILQDLGLVYVFLPPLSI